MTATTSCLCVSSAKSATVLKMILGLQRKSLFLQVIPTTSTATATAVATACARACASVGAASVISTAALSFAADDVQFILLLPPEVRLLAQGQQPMIIQSTAAFTRAGSTGATGPGCTSAACSGATATIAVHAAFAICIDTTVAAAAVTRPGSTAAAIRTVSTTQNLLQLPDQGQLLFLLLAHGLLLQVLLVQGVLQLHVRVYCSC